MRNFAGHLRFNGLFWGVTVAFIAFILTAAGFLHGIDNYLNALIMQYGYQLPHKNSDLVIVKKDQATSELLGKNPDRKEFASLFSFLGGTQVVARQQKVRGQRFEIFRLDLGFFAEVRDLSIKTSFDEWSGFRYDEPVASVSETVVFDQNAVRSASRLVRDHFKENPQKSGMNFLLKLDGQFWPPRGQNIFKVLAGGSAPLLFPTLFTDWGSRETYDQIFAAGDSAATGSEKPGKKDYQSPVELLQRWQNLLTGLGSADFSLRFSFFPRSRTVFSLSFVMTTPGLPSEYVVEPAAVIAFDFVLQGTKLEAEDLALEHAIASSAGRVILAAHTKLEEEHSVVDASELLTRSGESEVQVLSGASHLEMKSRHILPQDRFIKDNSHVAMIDVSTGNKSYVTEIPLFVLDDRNNRLLPSFSLLTAMLTLDAKNPGEQPSYRQAMEEELAKTFIQMQNNDFDSVIEIKDMAIPVNLQGRMLIDFVGSTLKGRFARPAIDSVSLYECLDRKTLEEFKALYPHRRRLRPDVAQNRTAGYGNNKSNKVMLVGPFELSDFDFYPTPLSLETPFTVQRDPLMGIEIHANAVLNILEKRYLKHPDARHTVLALFLSSILLGFLLDILSPVAGAFLTLAFMGGAFWHAFSSFQAARQMFNFASLLFSFPVIWSLANLSNYIKQRARARSTKEMFSRFVAADVVQYMLDNPELVKPGGEKVELTIFFSDVAGFTSISEALTPEELVVLLNEYLGAMTDLLFEYGGTLDKFIGDAVMAFWNFPQKQEDHSIKGCLCALAMQRKINELQIGWAARGLPKVSARAGLNTANVVVGYMGSQKAQMNFTCMGDGVNLASRLEGANKEYGTALMISDAVYQKAKNVVTARFLDFLAVKGKKEPVKVFELVSEKGHEPPGWAERIALYDRAIQLHLDRHWDEAIAIFTEILNKWPDDGPSATYITRCKEYKEHPPPEGWDGRYILTHK